jgi:uncharacterized membrane protein YdbT with pleckstrin-like domain
MNPQDSSQNPPAADNPLSVMQPGERVICEIKRHPIGIFGIYLAAGVLVLALAAIAFILVPNTLGDGGSGQLKALAAAGFAVMALLSLVFVFISNKIYWDNRVILTSDSITEVVRSGLFDKQSSQLSLGHLEDITAEQNGILPHMFDYGVLKVETAGERSRFVFAYCPQPNRYAQQILSAREVFEQSHHGGKQSIDQNDNTSQPPPPQDNIDSYEVPS